MDDNEAFNHYINYGHNEGRIYNSINLLPHDFNIYFYKNYYLDLKHLNYSEAINHYINNGKNENRIYNSKQMNEIKKCRFVSLGGWCATKKSIMDNNINEFDKPFPFDHVLSTFEGIINCFETNFKHFFPKKLELDVFENYRYNNISIRGKYISFFHHNLFDQNTIDSFNRKIKRLDETLKSNIEKIIFIRTIISKNYETEINQYKTFINIIDNKYPNLEYLLIFIIPEQPQTLYYKNLSEKVFIFTLDDIVHDWNTLHNNYIPIYNYILNNDLFEKIPDKNENIQINEIINIETTDGLYQFRDDN